MNVSLNSNSSFHTSVSSLEDILFLTDFLAGSSGSWMHFRTPVVKSEWRQGADNGQTSRHSRGKLSKWARKLLMPIAFILFKGIFSRKTDAMNSKTSCDSMEMDCCSMYHSDILVINKQTKNILNQTVTAEENNLSCICFTTAVAFAAHKKSHFSPREQLSNAIDCTENFSVSVHGSSQD